MVTEISSKAVVSAQPLPLPKSNVVELKSVNSLQDGSSLAKDETLDETSKSAQMEQAASRLNDLAQSIKRDLKFSVDDDSGNVVITVLDQETNEVIRQIPEEHVLAVSENIETLKGILFSAKI